MNRYVLAAMLAFACYAPISAAAQPAPALVGLTTDGNVDAVDPKTGVLTIKVQDQLTSFSIGGFVRKKNTLYYVAAPAGTSENAIYTVDLKANTLSKIDIDRSAGDDEVRVLFTKGKKLYGVFYNGTAGTSGIYEINPATGVTTLKLDLSTLDLEPIGGSFARFGGDHYFIGKPETNPAARSLVKFKVPSKKAPTIIPIATKEGSPVLCDRIRIFQANQSKAPKLICLASPSESQVDVCTVTFKGAATCSATLANVLRIAGGPTFISPNKKTFQALVYEPADPDNQRLITLNGKGVEKSRVTINAVLIGLGLSKDSEPENTGRSGIIRF